MSPGKPLSPEKRKPYSKKKISNFAINVQEKRLNLGLSQDELAKQLGISRPRVSEIEAGIFPTDPDRLLALADALQTTVDDLLRPKPEPKPKQAKKSTTRKVVDALKAADENLQRRIARGARNKNGYMLHKLCAMIAVLFAVTVGLVWITPLHDYFGWDGYFMRFALVVAVLQGLYFIRSLPTALNPSSVDPLES